MSKALTQTESAGVSFAVRSMSKDALADLVIDLVRIAEGDESMDGRALALMIAQHAGPILRVRGDRQMDPDGWPRMIRRHERRGLVTSERADTAVAEWYSDR